MAKITDFVGVQRAVVAEIHVLGGSVYLVQVRQVGELELRLRVIFKAASQKPPLGIVIGIQHWFGLVPKNAVISDLA